MSNKRTHFAMRPSPSSSESPQSSPTLRESNEQDKQVGRANAQHVNTPAQRCLSSPRAPQPNAVCPHRVHPSPALSVLTACALSQQPPSRRAEAPRNHTLTSMEIIENLEACICPVRTHPHKLIHIAQKYNHTCTPFTHPRRQGSVPMAASSRPRSAQWRATPCWFRIKSPTPV